MSAARFVVYGLVDPRDGLVHYVGRTKEGSQRPMAHWSHRNWATAHYGGQGRQTFDWIAGLKASGAGRYSVRALQTVATFEEVETAEVEWINRGFDLGWPLTNKFRKSPTGGVPKAIRDQRDAQRRRENKAREAARGGPGAELVWDGAATRCAGCREALPPAVGMVALSRLVQAFSDAHRACRPSLSREAAR